MAAASGQLIAAANPHMDGLPSQNTKSPEVPPCAYPPLPDWSAQYSEVRYFGRKYEMGNEQE
ncbi:hypothetical protein GCM10011497_37610 [Elstera cyanobacteriorum]|nr:hypothetical protein GCM10011497_37610 [Elstera cyanobacteriorum]